MSDLGLKKGGRIATNRTTYNREILIIEKKSDGKPFNIHTTGDDLIWYYSKLRNPWICFLAVFGALGIIYRSITFGLFALVSFFPIIAYQLKIAKIRREHKFRE